MGAFDGRGSFEVSPAFWPARRGVIEIDAMVLWLKSLYFGRAYIGVFEAIGLLPFPTSLSSQVDLPCFTTLSVYLVRLCFPLRLPYLQ